MFKKLLSLLFLLLMTGCSDLAMPETEAVVDGQENVVVEEQTVIDEEDVDLPIVERAYVAPVVEEKSASTSAVVPTPAVEYKADVDYYINVDNNKVQSPTYYDSVPAGASARCGDGTYSFSQHRRGTCSHHGGVSTWY